MYKKLILAILSFQFLFGQNYNTDIEKLATYAFGKEDIGVKISLNENNEIQFVKIIDSLGQPKDKLFSNIQSFFAYYYKDSKNVLQQQDKDNGIIIGKGYYSDFSTYSNYTNYYTISYQYGLDYSAYHTFRTDIKDNKVRVILTISNYSIRCSEHLRLLFCPDTKRIIDCEPFSPNYDQYSRLKPAKLSKFYVESLKRSEPQAFVDLCKIVFATLESFEQSMKEGNIKVEKDEW